MGVIRIRREGAMPHDSIAYINERCGFPGEPLDRWADVDWWVARDSHNRPVGFAGARALTAEPWCYFERAGVAPCARGQGLHRRLIRVRVRWARAMGLEGCLTYTLTTNPQSSNNLIACGFRLYEPDGWVGEPGRGVLYWRLLF